MSATPPLEGSSSKPVNRHALTAVERQRSHLEKLLKDPAKPAYVPPPPKEKIIRPAREMMKNVQGSSAGAGSGEFHVYKASRRREYERLKLLDETAQKESEDAEFERKRREAQELVDSKTAKNRAKRQKKKERSKGKGSTSENGPDRGADKAGTDTPIKKRRLVNGKELVFRRPGEDSDGDDVHSETPDANDQPDLIEAPKDSGLSPGTEVASVDGPRIVIYEED